VGLTRSVPAMKIFAAGIVTETNTFSPVPTALADFIVQRGKDVLAGRVDYPNLDLYALWGQSASISNANSSWS
jgi:microcystin degradation protein MlrC